MRGTYAATGEEETSQEAEKRKNGVDIFQGLNLETRNNDVIRNAVTGEPQTLLIKGLSSSQSNHLLKQSFDQTKPQFLPKHKRMAIQLG